MADTTNINKQIEPYVRDWLSHRYAGIRLAERKLPTATGKLVSFDAVSDDLSVVAQILSNRPLTRSGNTNTGGLRKAEVDFWRLASVTDSRIRSKLMVFTDADFCERVLLTVGDPETVGIQFEICELSSELQDQLVESLDEASREQRAAGDK